MKIISAFCILVLLTGSLTAETISPQASSLLEPSRTTFSFSPSIRSSSGETEYEMDIDLTDATGRVQLRSLLEYPLDYIMAGAKAELVINAGRFDQYSFSAHFYTSMTDPNGAMFDSDWSNLRNGVNEMFSYTESNAEIKTTQAQLRVERRVYSQNNTHIGLFAGFRYSKIDQEIFGLAGWQLDQIGQRHDTTIPDIHALSYEVTYKLPHAGVRFSRTNLLIDLSASAAYTIVLVSDVDDHILRSKLSTADINGKGLLAEVEARLKLKVGGLKFFLTLSSDISYLRASGTQVQTWYADEYGWVWDDNISDFVWDVAVSSGTSITGLPHDINLTQYTVGLDLGLTF